MTPTYSPVSGWESPASGRKLAFLDSSGVLWLANADGSRRQRLAQTSCFEQTIVSWAPLGDRIGVFCSDLDTPTTLQIFSATDGSLLSTMTGVEVYRWSPDGTQIAHQDGIAA